MRRKMKLAFGSLLLIAGCAEPKYVTGPGAGPMGPPAQESKASCSTRFSTSGLCVVWYWEKVPTENEPGQLIFKTYRLNALDQTPIEVDTVNVAQVVLWMPSMGHGSTPTTTVQVDTGTYRSSNVFFVMPGEWEIKFHVQNESGTIDEAKVTLTF